VSRCFKYLNDYYDVDSSCLFQVNIYSSHATRGHNFKLSKSPLHTNVRRNFFSLRVVNNWNALPMDVVYAPSLNSYKNRLDKFWENHPLKYDPGSQ